MDATTSPPGSITCAKPGCGNVTTLAESVYVEGCGQVCPGLRRAPPCLVGRHRAAVLGVTARRSPRVSRRW